MGTRSIIYRLRRSLADLLAPPEEADWLHPLAVAAPEPTRAFEEQLRALLLQSGESPLLAGRLNVIGLQKVKKGFGAGWSRIAERADAIARRTIERHLASGDIYTSINALAYVTVFAHLSPEQAKLKCLAIADEIAKTLFGEQGGDLLEVKTTVTRIDGTLDLETVSLTAQLSTSLGAGEERRLAEPQAFAGAPSASRPPSQRRSHDILANLRFLYRPFWDRARNVVPAYLCFAQVLSADGTTVLGEADALIDGDIEERARLDGKIRARVMHDLTALSREGGQLLLTLPVHFETVSAVGRRRDFLMALSQKVAQGEAKHLLLEIAGVPAGVQQQRLAELTAPLRGLCRGFLLSLPLDTVDFGAAKACRATAVGCDISGTALPEALLLHNMNCFVRAAKAAGIASYLHGAQSLSRVVGAIGAGFRYIDGSAVASPVENPQSMVDLRLDDLYRALMKGSRKN
jgi:hypothetical protein